jgi:hypothetical protein
MSTSKVWRYFKHQNDEKAKKTFFHGGDENSFQRGQSISITKILSSVAKVFLSLKFFPAWPKYFYHENSFQRGQSISINTCNQCLLRTAFQ